MTDQREWRFRGYDGGDRAARTWSGSGAPRYVALLCHGYGEHIGRYPHVASHLARHGAVVHGVD
ncbi:MAG: alpha/beta hydrolase, partial [Acidothermales bacterium]|nr:alpha/beta hydrolase [Acidothermales bacterium]